jgi:hypothetical protein
MSDDKESSEVAGVRLLVLLRTWSLLGLLVVVVVVVVVVVIIRDCIIIWGRAARGVRLLDRPSSLLADDRVRDARSGVLAARGTVD